MYQQVISCVGICIWDGKDFHDIYANYKHILMSSKVDVMNGVKQGWVLLLILFVDYTDGFDTRDTLRVGCHVRSNFTGAIANADDVNLLAPCKSVLAITVEVCGSYASEFQHITL